MRRLKAEVARLRGSSPIPSVPSSTSDDPEQDEWVQRTDRTRVRRGRAPPVDTFTGEDAESRLDDWLPTLQRAADWNGWIPDDLLIQLAGHLKGRALQEWNLLFASERAIAAFKNRLDPVSKIMAAQDFRHALQEEDEKVGDFIRRMEQLFKVAYGQISAEMRGTLLYGQGLRYRLIEAPAVSGAADYQALCMAAKAEEKRLAELMKRRQYRPDSRRSNTTDTTPQSLKKGDRSKIDQSSDRSTKTDKSSGGGSQRRIAGRCWNCDRPGHVATECRAPKSGASGGTQSGGSSRSPHTNQVQTSTEGGETPTPPVTGTTAQPRDATETTHPNDPLQYLLPDSDEEGVARVTETRVKDQGSRPQLIRVWCSVRRGSGYRRRHHSHWSGSVQENCNSGQATPTRFQTSRQNTVDICPKDLSH